MPIVSLDGWRRATVKVVPPRPAFDKSGGDVIGSVVLEFDGSVQPILTFAASTAFRNLTVPMIGKLAHHLGVRRPPRLEAELVRTLYQHVFGEAPSAEELARLMEFRGKFLSKVYAESMLKGPENLPRIDDGLAAGEVGEEFVEDLLKQVKVAAKKNAQALEREIMAQNASSSSSAVKPAPAQRAAEPTPPRQHVGCEPDATVGRTAVPGIS